MKENGYQYEMSYLLDEGADRYFYRPGNYGKKAWVVLRSFFKRWKDARRAAQFDLVYLYRDAQFLGNTLIEQKIRRSGARMIFDFDDAIWIKDVSAGNRRFAFLKDTNKIDRILRLPDLVVAGNQFLAAHARQFNAQVAVFPSVIDLNQYYPVPARKRTQVCIGWTGSVSTLKHFELIVPVLLRLKKKYGDRIRFLVIGDEQYRQEELQIEGRPWNAATEADDLSDIDIGIMPLPDEEWSKGKCSMKGLQYMGMGIATVMSNIGMNREVIEEGVNGMLAANEAEWENKLSLLIENDDFRGALGRAGRVTIEQRYSVQANKEAFFHLLAQALL